ncbi:hypothetical protein T440DRAFT_452065 [Plenodomus tracheiphilus IPT5]|uniref:Uncharacterized protein n=1 Tax=Plenodomus tracheiphilus IPT5 TaxID=1408161 RepID=A0A6A7B3A0_9PLEO|nr:hypothetical protein T440DRAFT_452065 [Plenodomus tracheiphilus IPT5]
MSTNVSESALSKYRYEALFGVWLAVTGATFLRIRQYLQRDQSQRCTYRDRYYTCEADGETFCTCAELRRDKGYVSARLSAFSPPPYFAASTILHAPRTTQGLKTKKCHLLPPACGAWNAWGRSGLAPKLGVTNIATPLPFMHVNTCIQTP